MATWLHWQISTSSVQTSQQASASSSSNVMCLANGVSSRLHATRLHGVSCSMGVTIHVARSGYPHQIHAATSP